MNPNACITQSPNSMMLSNVLWPVMCVCVCACVWDLFTRYSNWHTQIDLTLFGLTKSGGNQKLYHSGKIGDGSHSI